MNLSPKRRAALFEKLRTIGKLTTNVPKVPTPHIKQLPQPPMPQVIPAGQSALPNEQVNPNFIGKGKQQRFRKLKAILG